MSPRSSLRVLMPQRFDVLSRAMDTSIVTQWYHLAGACDLVLWGPGLEGYVPGKPLDAVARDVDADVVLLPDWHHAIPGLWTELWEGADRLPCPVVWYLADIRSDLANRRRVWETVRPSAILMNNMPARLVGYEDLRERLATPMVIVQLGYDDHLFRPPSEPSAARDIDILLSGADDPVVYPTRTVVKAAARLLADRFTVVDLSHPGYWETTGVGGRGQALFGDLLRRAKLASHGTAYGTLVRKYFEAPACGAIGVGDLPLDEPDARRLAPATLAIDPAWNVARVAVELEALLRDEPRRARMAAAGPVAVAGCDHAARAHEYVAALSAVVEDVQRARDPGGGSTGRREPDSVPTPPRAHSLRTVPTPRRPQLLVAAPEPTAVPSLRTDWADAWAAAPVAGASRTRCVEAALVAADDDVTVIAFDPDAALTVDALLLANACRATGRVVLRPAVDGDTAAPAATTWALAAAPRALLLAALADRRGRHGLEEAFLALGAEHGWEVLAGGVYADPAGELTRLGAVLAAGTPAPTDVLARQLARACARAQGEGRHTTARELAGLGRLALSLPLVVEGDAPATLLAQDPELEPALGPADHFAVFDPDDPATVAAIAAHARRGPSAPTLHIGLPLTAGVAPETAIALLAPALESAGVDLDACADLALVARPLWQAELTWLTTHCALALDTAALAA